MTYLASPYSLKNSRGSILEEFLLLPIGQHPWENL